MTATRTRTAACPRSFEPSSFFLLPFQFLWFTTLTSGFTTPEYLLEPCPLLSTGKILKWKSFTPSLAIHSHDACSIQHKHFPLILFICVFISIIWLTFMMMVNVSGGPFYLFWYLQVALHLMGLKSMPWINWQFFVLRRVVEPKDMILGGYHNLKKK